MYGESSSAHCPLKWDLCVLWCVDDYLEFPKEVESQILRQPVILFRDKNTKTARPIIGTGQAAWEVE